MPPYTRTHTFYFSEDSIRPLLDEINKLVEDWNSRSGYMDEDVYNRGKNRLVALRVVADMLAEPAD